MNQTSAFSIVAIMLGLGLLYVGWANVGGLIPPFLLCGYVGDPSVHLGSNFALIYNGGCTPYDFAYVAFISFTVIGITFIASGLHFGRQYR